MSFIIISFFTPLIADANDFDCEILYFLENHLPKMYSHNTEFIQTELGKSGLIAKCIYEIDTKLKQGYVFKNISLDKYTNVYRKICMEMISSKYQLSSINQEKILNILQILNNNMYDKQEKQYSENTDLDIQVLTDLIKMDGFISDFKEN